MSEPPDAVAEREREVEEEREYRREYVGADALTDISKVFTSFPAKLVRDWVRSVLVPPAIKRLYDIGMGVQTFDTPTAVGSVVQIEAPAIVQVQALAKLVAIGVPTQLGLVDHSGDALPGVIALGPLDLDTARQDAHGERYVSAEAHARTMAQHSTGNGDAPPPRPMPERIAAGEFTVVEVNEGIGVTVQQEKYDPEAPPPDPATLPLTPEQRLLANRIARRKGERIPYPET